MPLSDSTKMSPEQYAMFWLKLQQATAAVRGIENPDIHLDVLGSAAKLPIEPCSIFQARNGLPATATWSTVKPEQIDVSQTSLVATILGVTAERLLIPSSTPLKISFQIDRYLLSVRRVNQNWTQSLFDGGKIVYKESLQMDRVAQILSLKSQ